MFYRLVRRSVAVMLAQADGGDSGGFLEEGAGMDATFGAVADMRRRTAMLDRF